MKRKYQEVRVTFTRRAVDIHGVVDALADMQRWQQEHGLPAGFAFAGIDIWEQYEDGGGWLPPKAPDAA